MSNQHSLWYLLFLSFLIHHSVKARSMAVNASRLRSVILILNLIKIVSVLVSVKVSHHKNCMRTDQVLISNRVHWIPVLQNNENVVEVISVENNLCSYLSIFVFLFLPSDPISNSKTTTKCQRSHPISTLLNL